MWECGASPPTIPSNDDRVLGAVSVSGPTNRMKGERFERVIPEQLLETDNVIERNVTFS